MNLIDKIFSRIRWKQQTTSQLSEINKVLKELQPLSRHTSVLDRLGSHVTTLDAIGVRVAIFDDVAHKIIQLPDFQHLIDLISIVKPAVDSYLTDNHLIAENVRVDVEALSVMVASLQMQLNHLEILLKEASEDRA